MVGPKQRLHIRIYRDDVQRIGVEYGFDAAFEYKADAVCACPSRQAGPDRHSVLSIQSGIQHSQGSTVDGTVCFAEPYTHCAGYEGLQDIQNRIGAGNRHKTRAASQSRHCRERGGASHTPGARYHEQMSKIIFVRSKASLGQNCAQVFIFDMGEPVKIIDLAKKMIRLSGRQDVKIEFTGLRHGEKLYEELLATKENTKPTSHDKIMIAEVREYDYEDIADDIDALIAGSYMFDSMRTVGRMKDLVPEFKSLNSPFSVLDNEK